MRGCRLGVHLFLANLVHDPSKQYGSTCNDYHVTAHPLLSGHLTQCNCIFNSVKCRGHVNNKSNIADGPYIANTINHETLLK